MIAERLKRPLDGLGGALVRVKHRDVGRK